MPSSAQTVSRGTLTLRQLAWLVLPVAFYGFLTGFVFLLRHRVHPHTPRLIYAVAHLPVALLVTTLFALLMVTACLLHIRRGFTLPPLVALTGLYTAIWLPLTLRSNFWKDDWYLLHAAAVRQSILSHPLLALRTLDTVDGNFRPLGTAFFYGYSLHFFGLHAQPMLWINFGLGLACVFVCYALARQLALSPRASSIAAALYLSRDLLYAPIGWACALGDTLVIFLCGLACVALLRAAKRSPATAIPLHLAAWLLFVVALFAKQSAFAMPFLAALIVLFRPGIPDGLLQWRKRVPQAVALFIAYVIPAALIFHHAKQLLARPPYPLSFSFDSIRNLFDFVAWYFLPLHLPETFATHVFVALIGLVLFSGMLLLLRRLPALLGPRPSDTLFLFLAACASIWMFLFLPTRNAAYYESFAALWLSIAFAIVLSAIPGRNSAVIVLTLAVIVGFGSVRIKQTGLIFGGGYVWGTWCMDLQASEYGGIQRELAAHPDAELVVIEGLTSQGSPEQHANMAFLASPKISRVLTFDPTSGFRTNTHDGLRPQDTLADLTDVNAYHWRNEIPATTAHAYIAAAPSVLWLTFDTAGAVTAIPPRP